jgi:hypothetical protein
MTLGVRTDKAHREHNESGYPSIADMRADIDWRRLGPGPVGSNRSKRCARLQVTRSPRPRRGSCAERHLFEFRTERLSLRLILRRVWQQPFVLEHLAEITAIDPAIARRVT